MSQSTYYHGRGEQRSEQASQLPSINREELEHASGYLASPDLASAVDVALTLGMPLLLTGEPGSGKSGLAHSLAWELGLGELLTFVVKSDTHGRDLFYQFDTVGRFHASQTEGADSDPRRFLRFNALGKAILYANSEKQVVSQLEAAAKELKHPGNPKRSVVLIDEIDKAPRDVPNDILTEIECMHFRIPEISAAPGVEVDSFSLQDGNDSKNTKSGSYRPIVVITSNSEKGLPEAFLRRCVYHHLPFPKFSADSEIDDGTVTVEAIIERRLINRYQGGGEKLISEAISLFRYLRNQQLEHKPSLAELINWLDYLLPSNRPRGASLSRLVDLDPRRLKSSVSNSLLKKEADQKQVNRLLEEWLKKG